MILAEALLEVVQRHPVSSTIDIKDTLPSPQTVLDT